LNTVTVHTTREYPVLIGEGLLPQIGSLIRDVKAPCKAAIISDTNVFPLFGKTAESSLQAQGFQTFSFIFPAGEASKNGETYLSLLEFLAENQLTRSDLVIALGGGVVGDMAGFAAATYLRGIRYIQVPTTLLAMVDSSVGGKTAIDLKAGKNLAGAFYQPDMVICDVNALNTLPSAVFQDGCAEVIKYGVLYDTDLFSHLEETGLNFDRAKVITRCVELKRDVVSEDEFDTGARQKLNLGHTIGHSIEAISDFSITHGQAVAMGMAIISAASAKQGLCDHSVSDRIQAILRKFSLPIKTQYTGEELYLNALSDKKRSAGTVNLIVPTEIGNCIILPTDITKLQSFIEAGL
jgi:3-dehydroquinate synthase